MKARSEMLKQVQHDIQIMPHTTRHPELVSGSVRGEEQERLNRKFQDITEYKETLFLSTKKYYILIYNIIII